MPPRPIVVLVVLGWLATAVWLATEKWLPWLRPVDEPGFAVELADEVAPQYASWSLHRRGKKIGNAETRMAPRKDGHFELSTRLRDLELATGPAVIKVPLFHTIRTVARDGDLVSLTARATLLARVFGAELKIEAIVEGSVQGNEFRGTCEFDLGSGPTKQPLEPIPLISKAAFSPFEPLQKYPPLRAGQTWRVSTVDPVSEALDGALRQVASRMLADAFQGKAPFGLPARRPAKELLARVLADTEDVVHRGKSRACWVIVFHGDELTAKTWVDVTDGRVLRQEATGMGDTVLLQRE
jgi:hypothetical protein